MDGMRESKEKRMYLFYTRIATYQRLRRKSELKGEGYCIDIGVEIENLEVKGTKKWH
jgi:hypothetical protein